MATIVGIKTVLDALATQTATTLGSTIGNRGKVFVSTLPDKPTNAIAILATGGPVSRVGDPLRGYTVQCLVRNTSYTSGLADAQKIFDDFDGSYHILSTIKFRIEPTTLIGVHYLDSNNRHVFPLNFVVRGVFKLSN
jgi:hypothetical protein